MKIGLDARTLGGRKTGDRTYWRGLIGGLAEIDSENEYFLLTREALADADTLDLPANFHYITIQANSDRVWSLLSFGRALTAIGANLAHVQYTVPPFLPCPCVTTVHDISFKLFPHLFSLKDRLLLNMSVPGSLRRADAVVTVSWSSRNDILKAYPFVPPDKVFAARLAVGPEFKPMSATEQIARKDYLAQRYKIDGDYVLSVGVLQPRKNLPMLIDAFLRARSRAGFSHKLAIAGKIGWLSLETEKAIKSAGDSVLLLGYVPDDDLPLLYGCAELTVYPSIYEGFGLPVLEAMASGSPVITGDNSSLPEVVGDAGILLSAQDRTSWEESLIRLIEDASLRSKLRMLGLERASTFSWKETARKTLEVYERVTSK